MSIKREFKRAILAGLGLLVFAIKTILKKTMQNLFLIKTFFMLSIAGRQYKILLLMNIQVQLILPYNTAYIYMYMDPLHS